MTAVPGRRRRRAAVVLAAVAALLVVRWLTGLSSPLPVRDVEVSGADGDRTAAIVAAAGAAGADAGSFADIDADAVTAAVDAVDGIGSVRLSWSWPAVLRISVAELVPYAAVSRGDRYLVVDAAGQEIRTVGRAPKNLPVVRAGTPAATAAALALLTGMPAELRAAVAEVGVPEPTNMTVLLADGRRVLWGSGRDNGLKARIVAAVPKKKADGIDVRQPLRPVLLGVEPPTTQP